MKKTQSSLRYLGFGAILAAPFFLFTPDYSVVDFFPDLFAYICILAALRKIRDISDVLESAAHGFKMVLLSTAARLLIVVLSFSVINEQERPTFMLMTAFCFAVFEFIYGLPAWNRFFDGLSMLAQTGSGTVAMGKKTAKIKKFTVTFLIIRYIGAILPEVTVFSTQKYDDSAFDWSPYTEFFRTVSMLIVLVIGIVWLVMFMRHMRKICKDSEFFDSCREKYEQQILAKPQIFTLRKIKSTLTLLCVTFLFAFDFYADDLNLIPDALFFAFAIITLWCLRKYTKITKFGIVLSVIGIATSVTGAVLSYKFHQQYTDSMVQRLPDAWDAMWGYAIFDAITSLLFVVVSALMLVSLGKLIDTHCGYIPETMSASYRENKLRSIRKSLKNRLIVCFCFAVLSGITGAMYDYMITYDGMLISDVWMPACVLLIAGTFISVVSASFAIKAEADSRYMLD